MQKVKTILEEVLGVTPRTVGNSLKVTLPKLNGNDISNLSDLYLSDNFFIKGIEIKRSGTGLNIIVTFE